MKRRRLLINLLGIHALLITGCSAGEASFEEMLDELLADTVPQITTTELATLSKTPLLLDARSKEEFDVSHLKGAQWIGFETFSINSLAGLDRKQPLVIYCSVGKRSELIGEQLLTAGFTDVRNLRGGIFQWANEGRPVINDEGPTEMVHPFNKRWGRWLK